MFITASSDISLLDTQFFMMKYGAFIVAGIIGCVATIGNNAKYTAVTFSKHLMLTIVLSVAPVIV